MLMKQTRPVCAAFLVIALCLSLGCEGGAPPAARLANSQATNPSPGSSGADTDGTRCALLTDDEVRDAIGPHDAGISDVTNMWGLQSCRWTSTTAQKNGWKDSIEVALFNKDRVSWAREEATGDPVKGVVEGAVYDSNYGDLWFNCARDRFCVVKARLAAGGRREQVARQLAQLVGKRLR